MNTAAVAGLELDSSMELEEVYLHFLMKFQYLQCPRSVAEAKIGRSEVEALQCWFGNQYEKPKSWCDRTWQDKVDGNVTASSREMLGALFVILASEVYRDQCSEDSAWPTIAEAFRFNRKTKAVLFANQQPTELCKIAMAAGARKLKLRNLIESEGKQEYFDTLKLQIGFTLKGALLRMPEWLDGFGCTTAVRILKGEELIPLGLESTSFRDLWKTLVAFRKGRLPETPASTILRSSPWVRSEWVPQLLELAQLRRQRTTAELPDESIGGPVCEPVLQWGADQSKPSLSLKVNEDRICEVLAGRDSAVFTIDGGVVGRWSSIAGGGFRGERLLTCRTVGGGPNLRPQYLTISSNGEPVETMDLADIGLAEPFLLFDLTTGAKVDPAANLNPSRDYVLVCDPDMSIPGVQPLKAKNRAVFRLFNPLPADTRLVCADAVCWEPQFQQHQPRRAISVFLTSASDEVTEIGSHTRLVIGDAPDDAVGLTLFVGGREFPMASSPVGWETTSSIQITLGLVMKDDRLRIRIKGPNYCQTVVPKLSLRLKGTAVRQFQGGSAGDTQWNLLKDKTLNRAAGEGSARIFDPSDNLKVYEGHCLIGTKRSYTVELRDLNGWGSPLVTSAGSYCDDCVLVETVEDRGCVAMFLPFGESNTLYMRSPITPTKDHAVWIWQDIDGEPQSVVGDQILARGDGFIWKTSKPPKTSIVAVTYEGVCLGSWWSQDHILSALRRPLSRQAVALMRWLKIPLLSAVFADSLNRAAANAPAEFLCGWVDPSSLHSNFRHRLAENKLETVIRALFWNYAERQTSRLHEVVRALGPRLPHPTASPVENFRKALLLLGEVCPSFAYNLARADAHDQRYRDSIRGVINDALGSETGAEGEIPSKLRSAVNECAQIIGTTSAGLSRMVGEYVNHLAGEGCRPQGETSLRRLGETGRGCHYLTASLLFDCLERTRT